MTFFLIFGFIICCFIVLFLFPCHISFVSTPFSCSIHWWGVLLTIRKIQEDKSIFSYNWQVFGLSFTTQKPRIKKKKQGNQEKTTTSTSQKKKTSSFHKKIRSFYKAQDRKSILSLLNLFKSLCFSMLKKVKIKKCELMFNVLDAYKTAVYYPILNFIGNSIAYHLQFRFTVWEKSSFFIQFRIIPLQLLLLMVSFIFRVGIFFVRKKIIKN